jgi:hypothetical protein
VTEDGDAVLSEQPMSLFSLLQSRLQTIIQGDPAAEVFVTGHSMGGALAAIFARTLTLNEAAASSPLSVAPQVKAVYTIGQPRFGDFKFVTGVERALHSTPDKPTYIRIVNINDIVPAMPPPGSQDLGPTSFQHAGFLMYISLFGRVMPQKEQPIITFARAVIVAGLTAFQSLGLWLAHWVPSIAPGVHSRVPFLMVATRFVSLATFLPIGIVQHIPANYHQALLASRPADWRADIDKDAAAEHTLLADIKQSTRTMAHNYYIAARKAVKAHIR